VITARNTDIGALIDSGNSSKELFHIASTDRMRVYVSVPEVYSREAKTGMVADLKLTEFPGRLFKARLTTTSQSIDATRTLLAEFEASNSTGELLPGAYAEVHLHVQSRAATLIVPVTALLFRSEGLRIGIVKAENRAALLPVTLGRDFGNEVEVVSGISDGDSIIVNPPDSLISNQSVRAVSSGESKGAQ